MILSRSAILKALDTGDLAIDPYDETLLGAASYDLRLANSFRRLHVSSEPLALLPEVDYRDSQISKVIIVPEGEAFELGAGDTALGITHERVWISPGLCGRLEGRSRFARLGLLIHISAGFMAPGTDNHQVLEISNMSPRPLLLYPGSAICQLIFERMEGEAEHSGRYRRQRIEDFVADPSVG